MPRPPTHGPQIVAEDISRLTRILKRVQSNNRRRPEVKQELIRCLNRAIALLATEDEEVVERAGSKATRKKKAA